MTSLYWERFYICPARYREYRDIDHRYIQRYTGNIVISRIVMSRFHCIPKLYHPWSPGIYCVNPRFKIVIITYPRPLPVTLDPRFSNAVAAKDRKHGFKSRNDCQPLIIILLQLLA